MAELINIDSDFTSIHLNDENEGRQAFFDMIMETLENDCIFPRFQIGAKLSKGVGGYFTDHLGIDKICLPDIVTIEDNLVTFKDDENFAIFVHEACHFLHFTRDHGEFTMPSLLGEVYEMDDIVASMKIRRQAEFEAGWRAMKMDMAYHLFPGSRINLDVNLKNMMNYDLPSQSKEWKEKWNKKIKKFKKTDDEDPEYEKFMHKICNKVKDFLEWEDPKHEIKL